MTPVLPLLSVVSRSADPISPPRRREQALLITCSRTRLDAHAAARVSALIDEELDWEYLISTACQHGVVPLLQRSLLQVGAERIPGWVRERLSVLIAGRSFHHLVLTHELLSVLKLLEDAGISAIPVKGPVLALTAYGSVSLRDFSDLDLILDRRDASRALAVLEQAGYVADERPSGWRGLTVLATEHHYGCTHPGRSVRVELHWAISPLAFRYPVSWRCLREGAGSVQCGGRDVPQLRPEEMLLLLCVHGSKHRWLALKWICDIAEFIGRRPALDWDEAVSLARRRGVLRMLLLGIYAADRLFGVQLPEEVRRLLAREETVAELAGEVFGLLFSGDVDEQSELHRWRFHLRMRERWRDRLLYTAACIVLYNDAINISSRDRAFLPWRCLQSSRVLQYLVRPLRVATEYLQWRRQRSVERDTDPARDALGKGTECPWDLPKSDVQEVA